MNERIKELAQLAGLIAGEHDDLDFKKNIDYREKKFAELIIRECAKVSEDIDTLEQLQALIMKYGNVIVNSDTIEIYDDWRE